MARAELTERADEACRLLRSLANRNRLAIVCTLAEGERSVGELETELGIRQPTLSQQLAALREDGLVKTRRDAKRVFYSLTDDRAAELVEALYAIFCGERPARG
ncbi:metalloregulator ArsR/SmtB family transcription factor [Aquibium sp. A9E412]|uniref:ArsR/SmtB family transcription factor n=1 Tax=Aquibium sp. A9E412 TaxID=2976767 RepID=UPI0025B02C63|nr:metalloregulator ArsR/SmtB family transcription factor [Aquibium sp. A9E412]MDN2564976.1 metalloregulator ArsR/SmtB family transcription factor [Aquibium sp. A9E412]